MKIDIAYYFKRNQCYKKTPGLKIKMSINEENHVS